MGGMRNNAAFLKLTFEFLDIPNQMYQGSLTVEKRMDQAITRSNFAMFPFSIPEATRMLLEMFR